MYEGKLVRLRAHRQEDAEQLVAWLNDPDTAHRLSGGFCAPYTVEEEREWIRGNAGHQRNACHFAVETLDGRLIGGCSYQDADWKNRRCMVGWFIGDKDMRGRGYGSDMIRTLLDICFRDAGFHKVSLNVFAFNEPAIRLYEKLGFVREGALREHVFVMGRWWDEYHYSILDREYQ